MTTTRAGVEHIGVGIDTARYAHHVSFFTPDRHEATRAIMVEESGDGYHKLQSVLEKLKKKYPRAHFHIHVDAAGQYATNLEHFLQVLDLPKTISVGQPKQNKVAQRQRLGAAQSVLRRQAGHHPQSSCPRALFTATRSRHPW